MIFPTDQEYFKDIGSDGRLDPERFDKEQTTAYRTFIKSSEENQESKLTVRYSYRGEDPGVTQEQLTKTVNQYETDVFIKAADDAYAQTRSGYIGKFPEGKVHIGHFSDKEDDLSESAIIIIKEQLEAYKPIDMDKIRERRNEAVDNKKSLRGSKWGVLFLLLHLAVVAAFLLPMIPGLDFTNPFGTERNWVVIGAACVSLAVAWYLHVNTSNLWLVPGGIHMLLTVFFLGSQESKTFSGFYMMLVGGVIVVISVLSIGRYLADGFSRYYRSTVREFRKWCQEGYREEHRKLRFAVLWYRDITGKNKTPFDDMEKELGTICDKGRKI